MQSDNNSEALTYVSKEPSINTLRYAYDQTVTELESYFDLCSQATTIDVTGGLVKVGTTESTERTHSLGRVPPIWRPIQLMSVLLA